jgi:adenylate kinase
VLLGAPGAGKGTQCKRIAKGYGVQHLSSGDILRKQRAKGTELGKKAQSYMDAGQLVPDQIIVEMMIDAIEETPAAGFVLDGFPRTVNQAAELDRALSRSGHEIDAIINLQVRDEVVLERMTGRRSCPKCGAVYHIKNLKPRVDEICDNDGTKLVQRPDDEPQVVANRLKTYHRQTEPVVEYYKQSRMVYDIDANNGADGVGDLIIEKLDALAKT